MRRTPGPAGSAVIGLGSAVFVPSPVARPSRCFEVPMSESIPSSCLQIVSNARSSGVIELSLAEVEVAAPGENEVTIRVEAAPINPSDLGLLVGDDP